jgi:hypothetical protein
LAHAHKEEDEQTQVNEGLKGTLSLMLGVGMASALFCDERNVAGWFREESGDRGVSSFEADAFEGVTTKGSITAKLMG